MLFRSFEANKQRIVEGVRAGKRVCNPFALMAITDNAEDHFQCAEIFGSQRFSVAKEPMWRGETYRHRRKRVAFISGDFRTHPVGYLLIGMIERMDKRRFEITGISTGAPDGSDLFLSRLNRMVPFKAAAAAHLALLGRAAEPDETSRFLATRCDSGLRAAIEAVLNGQEYARSFGRDTVPHLKGMATSDGLPLSSVNRTAALYGGNAALNPS